MDSFLRLPQLVLLTPAHSASPPSTTHHADAPASTTPYAISCPHNHASTLQLNGFPKLPIHNSPIQSLCDSRLQSCWRLIGPILSPLQLPLSSCNSPARSSNTPKKYPADKRKGNERGESRIVYEGQHAAEVHQSVCAMHSLSLQHEPGCGKVDAAVRLHSTEPCDIGLPRIGNGHRQSAGPLW